MLSYKTGKIWGAAWICSFIWLKKISQHIRYSDFWNYKSVYGVCQCHGGRGSWYCQRVSCHDSDALDIKSRLLLPAEKDENGDEIDPREELVTRLVEYKTYKSLGEQLKSRQLLASRLLYKDPTIPDEVSKYEPPVNVHDMLSKVTLERLQEIYRMVTRRQVDKIDPVRSKFGNIEKDPVRLSQKLALVYEYAQQKKHFSFRGLLQKQYNKGRCGCYVSRLSWVNQDWTPYC